jgi:hypothetical protein
LIEPFNTLENSMKSFAFASALAISLIASAASAQAVRTEKNMSLELANQIAAATVASCSASGYNVTAAVVDRAGNLRALQRADNAGPQRHHRHAGERAEEPRCRDPGRHSRLPHSGRWRAR